MKLKTCANWKEKIDQRSVALGKTQLARDIIKNGISNGF